MQLSFNTDQNNGCIFIISALVAFFQPHSLLFKFWALLVTLIIWRQKKWADISKDF